MATHFECPTRTYTNQINSHHYRTKKEKEKKSKVYIDILSSNPGKQFLTYCMCKQKEKWFILTENS